MRFVISAIIMLGICSCTKKVSKEELSAYVHKEENGLVKQAKIDEVVIRATYTPQSLLFSKSQQTEEKATDSIIYFVISFSKSEQPVENHFSYDAGKFAAVISYLSFGIQDRLFLIQKGDTIEAVSVLFDRSYNMSSSSNLIAAFNLAGTRFNSNIHLIFKDNFFGLGTTDFEFEKSDLNSIPKLN